MSSASFSPKSSLPTAVSDLFTVLNRNSPVCSEFFEAGKGEELLHKLDKVPVLVVGAGGLGCEILKDLAMSGFGNIHVIDMDKVEYSNLNRQFLFRKSDVGKPKALAAAEFINKRCGRHAVTAVVGRLQDQPREWYRQFKVVVSGLDSVDARRYLNSVVASLVQIDEDTGEPNLDTVIPIIDGGSEGFRGQVFNIAPFVTPCFECLLDTFPPQMTYPLCTIASEPRLPEHCIQYAAEVAWGNTVDYPKPFPPETKLDSDNTEHMNWVFETAKRRAEENGIEGVTLQLTYGVVKNVVPAIAGNNALIAGVCANEAFKFITECSDELNNSMNYTGTEGAATCTIEYQKNECCVVCGERQITKDVPCENTVFSTFVEELKNEYHLKSPSIGIGCKSLILVKKIITISSVKIYITVIYVLRKTARQLYPTWKRVLKSLG